AATPNRRCAIATRSMLFCSSTLYAVSASRSASVTACIAFLFISPSQGHKRPSNQDLRTPRQLARGQPLRHRAKHFAPIKRANLVTAHLRISATLETQQRTGFAGFLPNDPDCDSARRQGA